MKMAQSEKRQTEVKTPEFRVSYPNVFKTKHNDLSGKDEYTLDALFPKDTTDLKPFKAAIKEAIIAKWGSLEKSPMKKPSFKMPIKDGDEMENPEYAGMWVMTFKSSDKYQPNVVGTKKGPDGKFLPITEKEFYGGCYARAVVNAYGFDVEVNKGVNFGLGNIQKLRDGERFGGAFAAAEDDFGDIAEEYDEDAVEDADIGF
jgi:hypothetical protein